MEPKHMSWSRRNAILTMAGGISSGLLLQISHAHADRKMTRAEARYQDMPNGIYSCATCTLFERPRSCKVVEGDVSEDGWCKAFALAD